MGDTTGIPWTNRSWNPWRGCTKIHARCKNCYMFHEQSRYGNDPSVVMRTKTWGDPPRWQRKAEAAGRTELVFTCSWSDWFHADADAWREEAWSVVKQCPNLIFQVLTKRPERIADHLPSDWGQGYPNVWLGSSLDPSDKHGMALFNVPAKVRFLSLEPVLASVDLEMALEEFQPLNPDLSRKPSPCGWVICGGESGPGARPCNIEWLRAIVAQCKAANTPCFVKQLGSKPFLPGVSGLGSPDGDQYVHPWPVRHPKGGDITEFPDDLQIRQFPTL